ncbi:Putative pseudouridine synthase I, TruA, pseudouridine synthase TruA/RsuA/RluB/E/F [Septoria linicola]|uniref:tRNA pseudouridine synthase 1 n=1 Tax=Septoria linicola TaxID=215465 RepID=A0A9Q9AVD2_9PEZI|nr:putative pseudouridine synthase I, TruA, pseudouridine synthase TruA/RsuA/RluB/E/F [Septoria linicola]USW52551.1 Putative pseudouridine synthase I, TruA, pseudouridine synthase TruA/RsuA/RluB/E/F [Septoria linicola]
MDHSAAILEDAGKKIDNAAEKRDSRPNEDSGSSNRDGKRSDNRRDDRKRKGNWNDNSVRHGKKGKFDDNRRNKKGDMGRADYFASNPDKRKKNEEAQQKRQREGVKGQGIEFSKEEIEAEKAEGRKPKRKVAVLIGYSGTGYKGMQISGTEKTIEGDLFQAFIRAGAISKANAEDPKKSSLVRCARTDKGVHAAGNMISLKLIVEEDDIVEKINAELSPQIRVWGIERTIGSFSCYQACDSRWYEYLMPSYAFLPPHPSSWLAKQLEAAADEVGDREGYEARQEEVKGFWQRVDEEDIKPILETIDEDIRWEVVKALQGEDEANIKAAEGGAEAEQIIKPGNTINSASEAAQEKTEQAAIIINEPAANMKPGVAKETNDAPDTAVDSASALPTEMKEEETTVQEAEVISAANDAATIKADTTRPADPSPDVPVPEEPTDPEGERTLRIRAATKALRSAYVAAKRKYRIPAKRVERIQSALNKYIGTKNYHNFTIQKTFKDPSVKRHIKSFKANPKPILIGDGPDEEKTEWLSLKVHGQSFMMHQIRKMVGMVTLLVRAGADLKTMDSSFTDARFSIPKVPGLGLLLERPVFDTYNNLQASKHGRENLDFSKFETELEAFKEREIYQRIFREEEEKNEFSRFFNHVDNFKEPHFLFVTSKGVDAIKGIERKAPKDAESDTELGGADN